jgi:hypothetical protein
VGTRSNRDKSRSARDRVTVCWQNAPMGRLGHWFGLRDGLLAVACIGLGLVVGYLDSRPTWDDTGITVALLLLTSAMAAGLSGRRPWLWALLIGAWVPVFEITGPGGLASLTALAVSAAGALGGYALARGSRVEA